MKVPTPRKLKSGTYFIQLRLGGESISVTGQSEKECIKKARLLKAEYKAGKRAKAQSGDSMTLKQAITAYIESRENVLSVSTVRGYTIVKDHRFQQVADKRLKDINWQKACNDEAALISAKTLKNAWGLIGSVLRYSNIDVPKVTLPQVVIKEAKWLEPDDIPVFLKAIEGDECEIAILLGLHGLRASEIFAVTKDKIDLKNKVIKVEGSVVPNKSNEYVLKKENKNSSSRRSVPIMIARLSDLVETSEVLLPDIHPNTLCTRINKICKAAKLPEVGVHGLRRSFASLCYHLGISEMHVMKMGGWSDLNTMRKIYTKLAERDILLNQSKLVDFYKNADKNKAV